MVTQTELTQENCCFFGLEKDYQSKRLIETVEMFSFEHATYIFFEVFLKFKTKLKLSSINIWELQWYPFQF